MPRIKHQFHNTFNRNSHFEFCTMGGIYVSQTFLVHWVMALGLRKFHKLSVFRTFFLTACRYSFDIWYIALPYQVTDQVRVCFDWPIFHWVMALGLRKFHNLSVFRTLSLTVYRCSFDIWYIALPYQLSNLDLIYLFFTKLYPLSFPGSPIFPFTISIWSSLHNDAVQ